MKQALRFILFYTISCLILSHSPTGWAGSPLMAIKAGNSGAMTIRSNTLEIEGNRNVVTFSGDVDVERDDFTIHCDKILLYYQNPQGDGSAAMENRRVDKIIATGHVKIVLADGGSATAEEAVYYQGDEKVVLTGMPIVRQNNDFVEGTKITLFVKEKRSIVEGSKDKKIRAVLYPKAERGGPVDR